MIDLNSILVGTRHYLLNEMDGLPVAFRETKDKTNLILTSQKVVEGDLLENSDSDDLGFLKAYFKNAAEQNNKVIPFFSRLLLLKFLYEETLKNPDLIGDKHWFREMRDKLKEEFNNLKKEIGTLQINGRQVHSLDDLAEIRRQAREDIQGPDRFRPILWGVLVMAIFRRTFRDIIPERINLAISLLVLVTALYGNRLINASYSARNTLFAAQHAEANLRQQPNQDAMQNESIKKFFLLNDEELNVFNKGPKPN